MAAVILNLALLQAVSSFVVERGSLVDEGGGDNILQYRHNVPILKRGWPWSAALE